METTPNPNLLSVTIKTQLHSLPAIHWTEIQPTYKKFSTNRHLQNQRKHYLSLLLLIIYQINFKLGLLSIPAKKKDLFLKAFLTTTMSNWKLAI